MRRGARPGAEQKSYAIRNNDLKGTNLPASTAKWLKSRAVDLEAASGERDHQLPVPAVYVVATDGRIQFAYVNPDYSVRLDPELLLAALQTARK